MRVINGLPVVSVDEDRRVLLEYTDRNTVPAADRCIGLPPHGDESRLPSIEPSAHYLCDDHIFFLMRHWDKQTIKCTRNTHTHVQSEVRFLCSGVT